MNALTVEKLFLQNGDFEIQNVSLSVEIGKSCAVIGKSGAGKSTLIRLLAGAVYPDAGRILYGNREMYEDEAKIRKEMSVMFDAPNFNEEFKPEYLIKELQKFEPWIDRNAFENYMELFELPVRTRIKIYSEGMQKKLMLALALCRHPELLIMDEPTSGVDAESVEKMWSSIAEYREKNPLTMLYTTYNTEEIKHADIVLKMSNGTCWEGKNETVL